MSTVSASVARQTLTAQLDKVAAGEEVAITRHGKVVAVLVGPEKLKRRRNPEFWKSVDEIGTMLEGAQAEQTQSAALSPESAEELAQRVREERTAP